MRVAGLKSALLYTSQSRFLSNAERPQRPPPNFRSLDEASYLRPHIQIIESSFQHHLTAEQNPLIAPSRWTGHKSVRVGRSMVDPGGARRHMDQLGTREPATFGLLLADLCCLLFGIKSLGSFVSARHGPEKRKT